MAGFGLDWFEGRVPCPHCGSTDCCGVSTDKRGQYLMCIRTHKRVTTRQLEDVAHEIMFALGDKRRET